MSDNKALDIIFSKINNVLTDISRKVSFIEKSEKLLDYESEILRVSESDILLLARYYFELNNSDKSKFRDLAVNIMGSDDVVNHCLNLYYLDKKDLTTVSQYSFESKELEKFRKLLQEDERRLQKLIEDRPIESLRAKRKRILDLSSYLSGSNFEIDDVDDFLHILDYINFTSKEKTYVLTRIFNGSVKFYKRMVNNYEKSKVSPKLLASHSNVSLIGNNNVILPNKIYNSLINNFDNLSIIDRVLEKYNLSYCISINNDNSADILDLAIEEANKLAINMVRTNDFSEFKLFDDGILVKKFKLSEFVIENIDRAYEFFKKNKNIIEKMELADRENSEDILNNLKGKKWDEVREFLDSIYGHEFDSYFLLEVLKRLCLIIELDYLDFSQQDFLDELENCCVDLKIMLDYYEKEINPEDTLSIEYPYLYLYKGNKACFEQDILNIPADFYGELYEVLSEIRTERATGTDFDIVLENKINLRVSENINVYYIPFDSFILLIGVFVVGDKDSYAVIDNRKTAILNIIDSINDYSEQKINNLISNDKKVTDRILSFLDNNRIV